MKDVAKATGMGSIATTQDSNTSTATADGTLSFAGIETSSGGKATANGANTYAVVQNDINSTATANGTGSFVHVDNSTNSHATSTNDPYNQSDLSGGQAWINDGINSSATATGANSNALINPAGTASDPVYDSRVTATNGGTATITNDGNAPAGIIVADDAAVARGPDSGATVLDSQNSSLTMIYGESYTISGESDVHLSGNP